MNLFSAVSVNVGKHAAPFYVIISVSSQSSCHPFFILDHPIQVFSLHFSIFFNWSFSTCSLSPVLKFPNNFFFHAVLSNIHCSATSMRTSLLFNPSSVYSATFSKTMSLASNFCFVPSLAHFL